MSLQENNFGARRGEGADFPGQCPLSGLNRVLRHVLKDGMGISKFPYRSNTLNTY